MGIINSIIDFFKKSFDSPKKSIDQNNIAITNSYLTESDINLIAGAAQRFVQIINESLQIANSTKNVETKKSRVWVARQKLNELKHYVKKYPFTFLSG